MEEREKFKKIAELEAFLFYHGEPASLKKIAKSLNIKEPDCEIIVKELAEDLNGNSRRGLVLTRIGNLIQLTTKSEFQNIGQKLIEEEFREELTPAALETLSITAYLGPTPRSVIDYIRGVNSSFILRNLLIRGLIEREQQAHKGNVYFYRPSFEFLKHMGLTKPEELPEYEKYRNILSRMSIEENTNTSYQSHPTSPAQFAENQNPTQ